MGGDEGGGEQEQGDGEVADGELDPLGLGDLEHRFELLLDVVVDGAEVAAALGCVELAAGELGGLGELFVLHGDGRALPLPGHGVVEHDDAVGRPERDAVDRDPEPGRVGGPLGPGDQPGDGLAVGEDHDGGRGASFPSGPAGSASSSSSRNSSTITSVASTMASPIAVPSSRSRPSMVSTTSPRSSVGRHAQLHRLAEADEPDVDGLLDAVDELDRLLLGRVEPGRGDVLGHHRQRDVEHHHDDRALARHPLLAVRLGQAEHAHPEAEEDRRTHDVAPPGGPGRHDRVEEVEVGEPHRPAAPLQPAQGDRGAQQCDHQQTTTADRDGGSPSSSRRSRRVERPVGEMPAAVHEVDEVLEPVAVRRRAAAC